MPFYPFECKKCKAQYDELFDQYDDTGKWAKCKCPECGSKSKIKLLTIPNYAFAQPEGTDRWNSESAGHDYRFKHNIPKVKQERETAQALSHMGANPYVDNSASDIELDTGIHDPETRGGLS